MSIIFSALEMVVGQNSTQESFVSIAILCKVVVEDMGLSSSKVNPFLALLMG